MGNPSASQMSLNQSVANFNSARQSDAEIHSSTNYHTQNVASNKFIPQPDKFIQDKFKQSIFKKPHLTSKTTPGQAPYQLPNKYKYFSMLKLMNQVRKEKLPWSTRGKVLKLEGVKMEKWSRKKLFAFKYSDT